MNLINRPATHLCFVFLPLCFLLACNRASIPSPAMQGTEQQVVEAVKECQDKVGDNPKDPSVWGELGMVLHVHDFTQEALAAYEQASTIDRKNHEWPYLAALALRDDNPTESLVWFQRAAELKPRNHALHINYGQVLLSLGKNEAAQTQFEHAAELAPQSPFHRFGLARLSLSEGDLDNAHQLLNEAIQYKPDYGEAHSLLAQVHQLEGRSQDSNRHAGIAKTFNKPSGASDPIWSRATTFGVSARYYAQRGSSQANAGRFDEAMASFKHAIQYNPSVADYYANLAGVMLAKGQNEEAKTMLDEALKRDAKEPRALNVKAILMSGENRDDEAIAELIACIETHPENIDAHLNLGRFYLKMGDFGQARKWFETVLTFAPVHPSALNHLGELAAKTGDMDGAIAHWTTSLETAPNQMGTVYNLAIAYRTQGRHDEAISVLGQGLDRAPNSSKINELLAWELATAPSDMLRDGVAAVQMANRIVRSYPKRVTAVDTLAAAFAEVGEFEKAVKTAEYALTLAESNPELAQQIELRLALYAEGQPFRQPR